MFVAYLKVEGDPSTSRAELRLLAKAIVKGPIDEKSPARKQTTSWAAPRALC